MVNLPKCPKCSSEYTYKDNNLLVCPECGYEWNEVSQSDNIQDPTVVRDAHGNILNDGDTVALIKDLTLKGSSSTIKVGTKVKNIRLVNEDHNIDCKIDGFGKVGLKSEFVKKIS